MAFVSALPAAAQTLSPAEFAARAAAVQAGTPVAGAPVAGKGAFNCTIKPLRVVEVTSQVNGIVSAVLVRPGEHVKAGQPLVQLDTALVEADYEQAEAAAEDTSVLEAAQIRRDGLKEKMDRLKTGYDRKAVSAADYEAAKLDYEVAANQVKQQREALLTAKIKARRAKIVVDKSRILSPVDGVVGEDLINPGEGTSKGTLATIYVNQPLRVEAFVPSAALSQFVGSPSFGIFVDNATQPVPVSFDYAAQLTDLASGTISVFFTLENPGILPGSKCLISPLAGKPANQPAGAADTTTTSGKEEAVK